VARTQDAAGAAAGGRPPFFSRARIVARPGFNRWLVAPCALAIHLCIGEVYAFSVFKIPLTQQVGIGSPAAGDWTQGQIATLFSIAIVFLGLSAAFFGKWVERAGPRASGAVSAVCWGAAFLIGALAISIHNIWLLRLGYGVVGGIGLGIGYITPVSTLIKWFPDRRGLATGLAIMGFGGGAIIASPLSKWLMDVYETPTSTGVAPAFLTLGVVYLAVMLTGALNFRVPAPGWRPAGYTEPKPAHGDLRTTRSVGPHEAIKTPQFYLFWVMLLVNVTAGIGILEQASPMIQDFFPGVVTAGAAAGFVLLLSVFNMGGRFFWSWSSDTLGRKRTYAVFFLLGPALYLLAPFAGARGSVALFVVATCVIISMYGGGFATLPAYLSDVFGTHNVGAIHGRVLTAWSVAGVLGPLLVNGIREHLMASGTAAVNAYTPTMYLMAGLLVVGLVADLLMRPVAARHYLPESETDAGPAAAGPAAALGDADA
jgi:MFS family permease